MKITNNIYQKFLIGYLLILVAFWSYLGLTHSVEGTKNYAYSFMFGLMPLVGGIIGMERSKIWGRLKSSLGKAIFYTSLGLVLWGFGETIWSYYNIFKGVPAPYPSIADIGFAPSIFFWALGAIFLSRASGARFALKNNTWAKVVAGVLPVVLIAASYYLLIVVARDGVLVPPGESVLKLILDIVYPLGDVIAVTLATVIFGLSFKIFGGIYRLPIISILVGLTVMYAGDFVFSYTTTVQTFYNGNWGDLLLTIGLFLITFGVLGFASQPVKNVTSVAQVEKDI